MTWCNKKQRTVVFSSIEASTRCSLRNKERTWLQSLFLEFGDIYLGDNYSNIKIIKSMDFHV